MKKIVLFGMMTNKPVAGIAHLTMPYLVGLERLGYQAYYVEAHGSWPTNFQHPNDANGDGSREAAAYLDRVTRWFGFGGRWAFHARHSDGECYGMTSGELRRLYAGADLFLNLHGGTWPPDDLTGDDRLVLIDSDPVGLQVLASNGDAEALEFLSMHTALFSWGENLGQPDCGVPIPPGFRFRPTREPVLLDLWGSGKAPPGSAFTTIGNWRQHEQDHEFGGEVYHWSKHYEFLKFLDLPSRTEQQFELSLASCDEDAQQLLEENGWRVRPAAELSTDLDVYRSYIVDSRGEFTVAKDQNVRLRSGWFSDRSATYLAAGRPVVTQETGFSNTLPTGEGLFGFSTMDEILAAVEEINSDYERHSAAARAIASEYFDAERVLSRLLVEVGLEPRNLSFVPVSRRPTRLPAETVDAALSRPVPRGPVGAPEPEASIIVVAVDGLPFTRLCLESVLEHTDAPSFELIAIDNGSSDGTREYLERLAARDGRVRVIRNDENRGFPAAVNQGLEEARGETLVLLNNDAVVPRGWLPRLVRHLLHEQIGAVGPVTNRIGTDAEIDVEYTTYGEFLDCAQEIAERNAGERRGAQMLAMFCLATRRDVIDQIGPLDERFELGMFEDDDYAERLRQGDYRLALAEDVLVHHFGEASFGDLFANGQRDALMRANRERFEKKWGIQWEGHDESDREPYGQLVERIQARVKDVLPQDASILVVSRGDNRLLELEGRRSAHFPQLDGGVYAGHYPANSAEAIDQLERARQRGAEYLLFPQTSLWWLDHYYEFAEHLRGRYSQMTGDGDCLVFALDPQGVS
ncbi:MAG: glycosyltransferase family 2 protein [Actinomycetota bacterium]